MRLLTYQALPGALGGVNKYYPLAAVFIFSTLSENRREKT